MNNRKLEIDLLHNLEFYIDCAKRIRSADKEIAEHEHNELKDIVSAIKESANRLINENKESRIYLEKYKANTIRIIKEIVAARNKSIQTIITTHPDLKKYVPGLPSLDATNSFIYGEFPSAPVEHFQGPPLHMAAEAGLSDIVKILLEAGASINLKDHSNYTPLMYAAKKGRKDCVEMLIAAKADLHSKDGFFGDTALQLAGHAAHLDCAKLLLDAQNAEKAARKSFFQFFSFSKNTTEPADCKIYNNSVSFK